MKLKLIILTTASILAMNSDSIIQDTPYSLPVDPIADLYSYMTQPISENGKGKLAMFSYNENALLIYDLEEQEIERKIKYDHQGPKALNNMKIYGGLSYINADSIIYFDSQLDRVYLSNEKGNVYKRLIADGGNVGFGSMGVEKSMAYRKGHLYIQAWPVRIGADEMKNADDYPNHFGKISLKDGSVERLLFDFPAEYKGKDYPQFLKNAHIIYNQKIDRFIINFPLSHSIYVTDFKGNTKAFKAQSKLVNKSEELSTHKGKVGVSRLEDYTAWQSDIYEKLIHDPESGYYFRIARKGISERAYNARDFATEKEVLVLDENFKHVKTLKHHGSALLYCFFKGNEIFWNKDFKVHNLDAGNEDEIFFDQVKFNSKLKAGSLILVHL